ncbi:glycoside hydrolase family 7 protein [Crepidotus variabilis]|uniref:Glucanase n=1 Tax=Crepidotus variabilis TaxID=179855 RepID=A0A9P6EEL0_9AGAR|nr:glycoside hydrolase family 7 protein [Crepidotus variabilis]
MFAFGTNTMIAGNLLRRFRSFVAKPDAIDSSLLAFFVCRVLQVSSQLAGTLSTETHPKLNWQQCTISGGCKTVSGSIVLDAEWRWIHQVGSYTNCFIGNIWNTTICYSNKQCSKNCQLEGADYSSYGISTSDIYLLANETNYQPFRPLNQEFSVDVDVSALSCDSNGAISFLQMDLDGGKGRFGNNQAGAQFGTGYCSSKCPRDLKFISGEANAEGWTPSNIDPLSGSGNYGSCCGEMDVWESNSFANAFAAHSCDVGSQNRCTDAACGTAAAPYSGVCDPDGCDFNAYRLGNQSFYGPSKTLDSNKKIMVVTQFVTDSNTADGMLTEIRRKYIQSGKVLANPTVQVSGSFNSIKSQYCGNEKSLFGDVDAFGKHGGLNQVGKGLGTGMVLSFSLLNDAATRFLWLDSRYPVDKDPSIPGVARGRCGPEPPATLLVDPGAQCVAVYSNIKFGDIGTSGGL